MMGLKDLRAFRILAKKVSVSVGTPEFSSNTLFQESKAKNAVHGTRGSLTKGLRYLGLKCHLSGFRTEQVEIVFGADTFGQIQSDVQLYYGTKSGRLASNGSNRRTDGK